jgi:hypothetical protein
MSGLEPFAPRLRAVLPWFAGATIVGGVSGFYHLPKASFLYGLPSIAGFRELTGLSSILWGSAVPVRTVLSCFVGALIGALMGMGAYIAMNARTFGNALPWLLWSVAGGFCAAGVGELTFGIIFNTFGEDIASLRVQAFSFLYAGVPGAWAVFLIVFSWWLARGTGSRRVLAATLVATIVGLGLFGVLALETTSRLVTTLAPEQKVPAFVVLENFEGKRYPADLAPAPDGIRSGEKLNIQLNFLYQAFPDPALLMLTTVLAVCVCTWFMVFWSARNPSPDRGSA